MLCLCFVGSRSYSSKIDIWSAGCIFAELELRRPLFGGKSDLDQLDLICKLLGTPTIDSYPDMFNLPLFEKHLANMRYYRSSYGSMKGLSRTAFNCVFRKCLIINPSDRLSAGEIVKEVFPNIETGNDPSSLFISTDESENYHEFKIKSKLKELRQLETDRRAGTSLEPSFVKPEQNAGSPESLESERSLSDASMAMDDSPIIIQSFKRHRSDVGSSQQKRKMNA